MNLMPRNRREIWEGFKTAVVMTCGGLLAILVTPPLFVLYEAKNVLERLSRKREETKRRKKVDDSPEDPLGI